MATMAGKILAHGPSCWLGGSRFKNVARKPPRVNRNGSGLCYFQALADIQ
jgi:hypothetical protein